MRALPLLVLLAACGPSVHNGGPGDDSSGAPDAAPQGNGPDAAPIENAAVYAHTATTLFRVDPDTFAVTEVGDFGWPAGSDTMTDLAIDKNGVMIGVSYDKVYRVDASTAACTLLSSNLQGMFNGLSFVPATQVGGTDNDPDVLVGDRNTDGAIFQIDPMTGSATQIGDMGGNWVSSGDLVSVKDFGTVATVKANGSLGTDTLVRLDPITFHATPIGTDTGASDLWGIGFWKNKVFGFADSGDFVLIDTTTGAATPMSTSSDQWWGAAVTTAAPVVN
jgi:hypothetical protein